MRFDTKIAVLLRDDLEVWQRLNVTAFLASGIAADPELLGEPYADADGTPYLPMFRQPVLVLTGDSGVLAAAHERAVRRSLVLPAGGSPRVSAAQLPAGRTDGQPEYNPVRGLPAGTPSEKLDPPIPPTNLRREALAVAVFTEELFTTGHDEANRAAVRGVASDDLKLVGLAVHGPRNAVDKVLKGAVLHP